ncbi:hypothetical protein [Streptomyces sp. NPDC001914]|uniref:hypothetical protein n=1 Tax=Streptomyces sp. NPDC001914 TaxID=3364623 RepID=UPI0036B3B65B
MLECAEGHSIMEVSRRLRIAPDKNHTWWRRFIERSPDGIAKRMVRKSPQTATSGRRNGVPLVHMSIDHLRVGTTRVRRCLNA